ncbi:MAG: hypothetical protein V2J26_07385 [Pacificimonas sp.]|jgi:hypothetical protein|nr:hypothetical protein [Pacificimonas sp.]
MSADTEPQGGNKLAWTAAFFILAVGAGARLAIGSVYGSGNAIDLIGTLADSGLYLGSAVATASATMLALMLTVLGLAEDRDDEFGESLYQKIFRVAKLSTASLLGALVLLLALTLPMSDLDGVPTSWFAIVYNVLYAIVVLACALLAATVLTLYTVIRTIVKVTAPLDQGEG